MTKKAVSSEKCANASLKTTSWRHTSFRSNNVVVRKPLIVRPTHCNLYALNYTKMSKRTVTTRASETRVISLYSSSSTSQQQALIDPRVSTEILHFPGAYRDDEEKALCRRMVKELSPKEQEIAARTCYAYWLLSVENGDQPSEEMRIQTAMKEARRHVRRRTYERGMDSLRKSCTFREEWKVDLLRLCFADKSSSLRKRLSEDEEKFICQAESLIENELKRHPMVVRGHDRDGRVIAHRSYPRHAPIGEPDMKAFVLSILYIAERTFACNEILNKGRQDKVVGVLDYSGHDPSKMTPLHFTKESLRLLRLNYPERAHRAFLLDTPVLIRGLYTIVRPFLGAMTREKVCIY